MEFYKPASARRWGYYVLPVLYGHRLRARIEMRQDRERGTLRVLHFWPEDRTLGTDVAFAPALGRALARLADYHGAKAVDPAGVGPSEFRRSVNEQVSASRGERAE
ncbi:MAG: DNA glycosylase AlkZ-like family protein [Thermoplasmata archaeon]